MASNPMQKKSRNSFLLGMLLMLIISAIVIVILIMVLKKDEQKQEQQQTAQTYVYRLKTAVQSGEEITSDKVVSVLVNSEAVPTGASAAKRKITGKDGKEDWVDKAFDYDGYRSKIDLDAGTIICENMLYEGEELQDNERIQEYNMLQLPIQLDVGEYVDIRFLMSNGQDYIVVSHKEVLDITDTTIWLQLTEQEILLMSNAMVESYISPATSLYVTKYVEPGNQNPATITYIPSQEVITLMSQDPNIVNSAKTELISRYNSNQGLRENIVSELNKFTEQGLDNIQAGVLESREQAKAAREEFLYGID